MDFEHTETHTSIMDLLEKAYLKTLRDWKTDKKNLGSKTPVSKLNVIYELLLDWIKDTMFCPQTKTIKVLATWIRDPETVFFKWKYFLAEYVINEQTKEYKQTTKTLNQLRELYLGDESITTTFARALLARDEGDHPRALLALMVSFARLQAIYPNAFIDQPEKRKLLLDIYFGRPVPNRKHVKIDPYEFAYGP